MFYFAAYLLPFRKFDKVVILPWARLGKSDDVILVLFVGFPVAS